MAVVFPLLPQTMNQEELVCLIRDYVLSLPQRKLCEELRQKERRMSQIVADSAGLSGIFLQIQTINS
jgi:hypothetical protein